MCSNELSKKQKQSLNKSTVPPNITFGIVKVLDCLIFHLAVIFLKNVLRHNLVFKQKSITRECIENSFIM